MATQHPACVICHTPLQFHEANKGLLCTRPMCGWQYARLTAKQKCVNCARPLTAGRMASGVCEADECQWSVTRARCKEADRQRQVAEDRKKALVVLVRPAAGAAIGIHETSRYPLALIPKADFRLVELTADRRAALAAHLARVIAAADDPTESLIPDLDPPDLTPALAEVLGQACGLCQGYCCGHGGNAAYLFVSTIRRYRQAHPEQTPEEVISAYLARLSDRVVAHSCIYHQPTGCGLPRDMRSMTCNRHFCHGLNEFRKKVRGDDPVRGFFVALRDPGYGPVAFIDETGTHHVPEAEIDRIPV